MDFLFLGDVVLTQKFESDISTDASLLLFNLEAPIIKQGYFPSKKAGPNLSSKELFLPPVNSDCVIVANLANNHIMDYGYEGLEDTLTECSKKNVLIVGAGEDLEKARLPLIIEVGGKRIGIVGCCETQFGISTPWKSGVASVGPWIYSTISVLKDKAKVDIIVVSIHGASEMSPWPSPAWQDLLRSFSDAGADILHGHHSHIPQGYEEYNHGLIFYGLGNFVVDPEMWKEQPNTLWSITPEVEVTNEKLNYKINTSVISKENDNLILVRRSDSEEFERHKKYLEICNKPLNDKRLLIALWQEVSIIMYYKYYSKYLNLSERSHEWEKLGVREHVKSFLLGTKEGIHGKRCFLTKATQDKLLLWYHLFVCESHQNSIATALGVLSGELEDMRTDETQALADEMMPWSIQGDKPR